MDWTRWPELLSELFAGLDRLHIALLIGCALLLLIDLLQAVAILRLARRPREPIPEPVVEKEPTAVAPPKPEVVAPPREEALKEPSPEGALLLLGLLQGEARFVDFVKEDITAYSDAEIGAAARIVHEGCRKVLEEHFQIVPILDREEGNVVTVPEGFDPAKIRLVGHIVGSPPFRGKLVHRGWEAKAVRLPKLSKGHRLEIIAPAEVEL